GAVVVIAALAALGGIAGRAVDLAGRRRGVDLAREHLARGLASGRRSSRPAPASLRRRAWLHVALPLAASQALVNAGVAWLTFHDYRSTAVPGRRLLTEHDVLAEVGTIVLVLVVLFATTVRRWGAVDAALGRVDVSEPSAPVGPQVFVYVVLAGLLLAPTVGWALPPAPSLLRVMMVRALLSFGLVLLTAALAYVRGATNERATPVLVLDAVGVQP
ncbi:MAG TPA: hypothetical protein VHN98_11390, partial [Acidimicrobiales bacterium]|nr:hypothetical protein [Acidimicrobiales bacterium]